MKQRPLATDLRGPKASAESLTPRRTSLAEADAVDFQSDLLSSGAALCSMLSLTTSSSFPSCSRSLPAGTGVPGRESGPDRSTLSPLPPAPGFSPLRLLPVSRCLISFFILESDSRMSSIPVSCWCRGWLRLVAITDGWPRGFGSFPHQRLSPVQWARFKNQSRDIPAKNQNSIQNLCERNKNKGEGWSSCTT